MFQRLASPSGYGRHAGPLGPSFLARTGLADSRAHAVARTELAPSSRFEAAGDEPDPLAQMAQADAADAGLMRLVLLAASATLALALVSSLL